MTFERATFWARAKELAGASSVHFKGAMVFFGTTKVCPGDNEIEI